MAEIYQGRTTYQVAEQCKISHQNVDFPASAIHYAKMMNIMCCYCFC